MEIRQAKQADANLVARLHVRAWQVAYKGLIPEEYLSGLQPEVRARSYSFESSDPRDPVTLVAIEEDAIVGFATTRPAKGDETGEIGELLGLYVDPERWGCGVGRALIGAANERLRQQGFREAILWVLAGNRRAERFYQHNGWSPDGTGHKEFDGMSIEVVRYRRSLA